MPRNVYLLLVALISREYRVYERLEPTSICTRGVGVPRLKRTPDTCGLRVGELELLRRQRTIGVPHHPRMVARGFCLQIEGLFLIGAQGDPVLHRPDGANRSHVCPLRTQERVQVQTLGVVQCQLWTASLN